MIFQIQGIICNQDFIIYSPINQDIFTGVTFLILLHVMRSSSTQGAICISNSLAFGLLFGSGSVHICSMGFMATYARKILLSPDSSNGCRVVFGDQIRSWVNR